MSGYLKYEASTGIRKMTGYKKGEVTVTFPDSGQMIKTVNFPDFEMHGLMKGTRTFSYLGDMRIIDEGNEFYGDFMMNPDKKGWFKRMFTSSQSSPYSRFEGVITNSPDFLFRDNKDEDIKKLAKKSDTLKLYGSVEGDFT